MPTADGSGPGTTGDGFYLFFLGGGWIFFFFFLETVYLPFWWKSAEEQLTTTRMDFKSCFSYVTHLVSDGSSARLGMGPRGV